MAKELSAREVEAAQLPEGKYEFELYDGDNLILRLRKGAKRVSKTWLFRYSSAIGRKKLTLGSYPAISLAEARDLMLKKQKLLEQGIDPKEEKAIKEAEALAAAVAVEGGAVPVTVRDLFERWDKDYLQHHHDDKGAYVRNLFCNHILHQQYADLRLDLVEPKHTSVALNNIRNKKLKRTCGVALTNLRQMYGFGMDNAWLDTDPTRRLSAKNWNGESVEKDRFLNEDEIKELYKKLYLCTFPIRWQATIWFLTAMGTRVEETMLAEIAHFNLEKKTWFIPKEHQKKVNNTPPKDKTLYLSDFAVTLVKYLISIAGDSRFLFPGRAKSDGADNPVEDSTLTKMIRDRQRDKEIKGRRKAVKELVLMRGTWTPHDLRRTMSTLMQELGIPADIIDKCQAHAIESAVRRIYQRAELRKPMTEAWQRWGTHLQQLLVAAHDELTAELSVEAAAESGANNVRKSANRPRSVRAGRGALGEPLLDLLAPYAPKHSREHRQHG